MKVTYSPEGGTPRTWSVDLENPAWDLTFATEKATDWPWGVFRERLLSESAIALRALLWVLRKRDEPKLQIDAVKPDLDEIDFAIECPDCKEWVTTEDSDSEHECPAAADDPPSNGEQVEGSEPGEA